VKVTLVDPAATYTDQELNTLFKAAMPAKDEWLFANLVRQF
jgi:hypothetical protein